MGMHHLQTEVFRVDFSRHLSSLLAIHLVLTHCLRVRFFFASDSVPASAGLS